MKKGVGTYNHYPQGLSLQDTYSPLYIPLSVLTYPHLLFRKKSWEFIFKNTRTTYTTQEYMIWGQKKSLAIKWGEIPRWRLEGGSRKCAS
jgi:hypothetical protein